MWGECLFGGIMRIALSLFTIPALLTAQAPPKDPIHIQCSTPNLNLSPLNGATIELSRPGSPGGVMTRFSLGMFTGNLMQLHGTPVAFAKFFFNSLESTLENPKTPSSTKFQLQILTMEISTASFSGMASGGFVAPTGKYQSRWDYCILRMGFKVTGPDGKMFIQGMVEDFTAPESFRYPSAPALNVAIERLHKRLGTYLRGRMNPSEIGPIRPLAPEKINNPKEKSPTEPRVEKP